MMFKPDYKKWFFFLLIAAAVVMLLTSCSASKKNVSIQKTRTDSVATETKKESSAKSVDSISKKVEKTDYSKQTEITYVPVEIDESADITNAGDYISYPVIKSPSTGKKIVLVPKITIKETGQKNLSEETHLQKKDTAASETKKEVAVKKEEKIIEKQKVKSGFNFWLLLWLLPLIIFLPKVRKYILNKL